MMFDAVLFDLDDTLYPEKQFVMGGFKAVSEYSSRRYKIRYNKIFGILKEDFERGLRGTNIDVLVRKLGLDEGDVEKLIDVYRKHCPTIFLYPDAEIILRNLKNRFKLGLITDGYTVTQRNKILALGVDGYFDVIIINDISKNMSKMEEEPFLKALAQLGVKPENALYVGDNPSKDFVSAKNIGIHTVRVKRPESEYINVKVDKTYEAEYIITDLTHLKGIIDKHEKTV